MRTGQSVRIVWPNWPDLYAKVRMTLFGAGEQGIYMPSVHESFLRGDLYQDHRGIAQVTVGQSVGLWLDRSQGLELGPELVTVPNVDGAPTGGGPVTSYQVASGAVVGRTYLIRFRAEDYTFTGEVAADVGFNSASFGTQARVVASGSYLFVATALSTDLFLFTRDTATCNFRDVTIRELPGNHASQSSASLRPAYRTAPERIDFDAVDDKLTATFASSLGSDCTIGISVPGSGASILTGQTIGTSYDITDDLCGIVIVDRALSQHETSSLTQLLDQAAGL